MSPLCYILLQDFQEKLERTQVECFLIIEQHRVRRYSCIMPEEDHPVCPIEIHAIVLASVPNEREKCYLPKQQFKPFIAEVFNIGIKCPVKPYAVIFILCLCIFMCKCGQIIFVHFTVHLVYSALLQFLVSTFSIFSPMVHY